jgi:hypothetical protein
MKRIILSSIIVIFLLVSIVFSKAPPQTNAKIEEIINSISEEKVTQILHQLECFETRNVFSEPIKDHFGIKAAGEWIYNQFKSYSPELKVYFDCYHLKKQGRRLHKDFELCNVIAVLPGKDAAKKVMIFIVNAHYDSIAKSADGQFHFEDVNTPAPGVNDDGSGIAALLEMARVMSKHEFDATIYFAAFAGEEVGLVGSTLFAQKMREQGKNIEGVIALDMIGNIEGGNGYIDNKGLRVFSSEIPDSGSQQLARYIKHVGEEYFPERVVRLFYRSDRFGRGGDHLPFLQQGFPGIRVMEANENYSQQHTAQDILGNMSPAYCTSNIKVVAAYLASLAWAPPSPVIDNERGYPMLSRGESGYDALLEWRMPYEIEDLAGYKVFMRKTISPFWENEFTLGKETKLLIKNLSIDEYVFGIAAFDEEGNESMVSSYVMPARAKFAYKTIEEE